MNRCSAISRIPWACIVALTGIVGVDRASADIVVQTNGKIVVGRVTQEDQTGLHLAAGTAEGSREISIPRAKIDRLLKGAEESRRIDASNDPRMLTQWTAAYYFAGLEASAARCLERALTLDATLRAKPMAIPQRPDDPAAKFVTFWNRATLRRLIASIPKGNTRRLLDTARWAREAGMIDASAYYLRRAWNSSPADEGVKRLAGQWSVALESWVQLDLTAALETSLLSEEIVDERVRVRAEPGKLFLTLPIRYELPIAAGPPGETASALPSISRATFRGKDARGFYGLKTTAVPDGRIRLDGLEQNPIYERLEFLPGEANNGLAVLRNKLGPRRAVGDDKQKLNKPRQTKLRDEPLTIRSTGTAALVFEVPNTAEHMSFEWSDGGEESVDLKFLREVREAAIEKIRPKSSDEVDEDHSWTRVPTIAKSLEQVSSPSPAMAALAIERLSKIRGRLVASRGKDDTGDETLTAWTTDVDSAIVSAAARDEERIRVAAWRYFCTHPADQKTSALSSEALDLFAEAESDVQSRWVRLVACGLRVEDGGFWWRQTGGIEPRPPNQTPLESNPTTICRSNAVAILGAVLRSENSAVVADAMDLLANLKPPVTDWSFLEEASIASQRAALSHVEGFTDRKTAALVVQALILSARPETASDIADAARALGSASDDPNDMLLSQWWSLHPPSRKPAFLAALCGIDLGESVYSHRFAEVIKDATAAKGAPRDAAWRLLIAQLRLRKDNVEAGNLIEAGRLTTSRPVPSPGPFPMIIARSANDPLTRGVATAAREASPAIRVEALKALIEAGYAEQAAVCLTDAVPAPGEREAVLAELIPLAGQGHRDAVLSMLGALLNKKGASSAARILDQLSRTFAEVDQPDHWRVLAAVKAGAYLGDLDELGTHLGPPTSVAVLRWLHALGHMSDQDRQRLAAANEPAERAQRLQQINFRRGQLIDGRYGVLAIISIARRLEPLPATKDAATAESPDTPPRWSLPKQITVTLDPLLLETRADQDVFHARWGDRTIGEGLILQQMQPIRGPAAYLPAMETVGLWGPPALHGAQSAAPPDDDKDDERLLGPLRLPDRALLERLSPGTMTLDLTAYLKSALKAQHVFMDDDLSGLIPEPYKITLRYGVCGSFYGCGPRRSPWPDEKSPPRPDQPVEPPRPPSSHFLLNVMLVVERMD